MKTSLRKKMGVVIMASILSITSFGQVFQKVGNGLSTSSSYTFGEKAITVNGEVYVGYENSSTNNSIVERWDGLAWHQYPKIKYSTILDIEVYNNDLYVAARNYITGANVYKFDGTNWVPIFSNLSGAVNSLEVHNGVLLCGGSFTEGTSLAKNLVGYNGSSISTYPPLDQTDSIQNISIINNEIWISGQLGGYSSSDTVQVKKLAGGTNWVHPAIAHNPPTAWSYGHLVFQYNNKVYSSESGGLYEIRNDTAHFISSVSANSVAEQNGNIYMAQRWGNQSLYLFDGTSVVQVLGAPKLVRAVTNANNLLYGVFSDTGKVNGLDYRHVFKGSPSYGMMHGKTFVDNNGNCTYEASVDEPTRMMRIS